MANWFYDNVYQTSSSPDHQDDNALGEPEVEPISLMERIRLMCGKAHKQVVRHSKPIVICSSAVLFLIVLSVVVGLCLVFGRTSGSLDNDRFYNSAIDVYSKR